MTIIEWVQFSVLIVAIVLSITLSIIVLLKSIREGFTRKRTATFVLALGLLFIIYLAYYAQEIHPADGVQIMLVIGLVAVTGVYALFTARQANASEKMAEEMREQRIMSSRPVIIQKAIHEGEKKVRAIEDSFDHDYFSHFEIYNAGNSPAIELELLLLDKDKKLLIKQRETFLRTGDAIKDFYPTVLGEHVNSDCYLLCRYQSIQSIGTKPSWYQTWLPFKPVKSQNKDYIYVQSGELEFEEVFEKKSY